MVLCGVGGKTIAQAKQCLSYTEFLSWARYRQKRGNLNVGMRVEQSIGLLAALYANSKSKHGGFKLYDFTPHDSEPPITLEKALETWH